MRKKRNKKQKRGSYKEMIKLLNYFLQNEKKSVKSILPVPGLEHRIVFKSGAVETIKKVKGWKTDAEMARALGLTRQYVCMMKKTRVGVTATVISRLAVEMGSISSNWWVFYEIVPYGVSDPDHPVWNQEKTMGRQPYRSRFSEVYQHRSKSDFKAEARNE